jgi:hypothetical protein
MKPNSWLDFLFTIVLRLISGAILGTLFLVFFRWKGILQSFSRDDLHGPLVSLLLSGAVGGVIDMLTVPYWQLPWYRRKK